MHERVKNLGTTSGLLAMVGYGIKGSSAARKWIPTYLFSSLAGFSKAYLHTPAYWGGGMHKICSGSSEYTYIPMEKTEAEHKTIPTYPYPLDPLIPYRAIQWP